MRGEVTICIAAYENDLESCRVDLDDAIKSINLHTARSEHLMNRRDALEQSLAVLKQARAKLVEIEKSTQSEKE